MSSATIRLADDQIQRIIKNQEYRNFLATVDYDGKQMDGVREFFADGEPDFSVEDDVLLCQLAAYLIDNYIYVTSDKPRPPDYARHLEGETRGSCVDAAVMLIEIQREVIDRLQSELDTNG